MNMQFKNNICKIPLKTKEILFGISNTELNFKKYKFKLPIRALPNRLIYLSFRVMSIQKPFAFSLIEMLMALLVASLLLAALAPVMTKRFNENINLSNISAADNKDWKLYNYSSICTKASNNDNVCEYDDFIVPEGVFSINVVMLSGGGGGAGATSSKTVGPIVETNVSQGLSASWNDREIKEIPITKFMKNVRLTRLAGGGGGGGGGAVYVPDCPDGTMEFKGDANAKAFCMTRFNVGERTNLVQPHDYAYVPYMINVKLCDINDSNCVNSNCYNSTQNCCVRATAAYPDTSMPGKSTGGEYNAYSRTLCQRNAIRNSCTAFNHGGKNWKMPSNSQLTYIAKNFNPSLNNAYVLGWGASQASKRLQLCDNNGSGIANTQLSLYTCPQGYGANFAMTTDARCIQAEENNHFCLYDGYLKGPTSNEPDYKNLVMSGRCTLEKQKLSWSASGSGGGAGRTLIDIDLNEYVKQTNGEGKILLGAGKRGKGGAGCTSKSCNASNGTQGGQSSVTIQKKNQNNTYTSIMSFLADGGQIGVGAFATLSNISGGQTAACDGCHYVLEGAAVWTDRECSSDCSKGDAGAANNETTAQGGKGGNSSLTFSGGGEGAAIDLADGKGSNALTNSYGAGGGGGTGIYSYNDTVIGGNGGNGAPGISEISYYNEFPGAGGGGGAGGTLVRIVNFNVTPGEKCIINVGGGGNGGSGTEGGDGGYTSISCENSGKEYIVYGGGGGKLGESQNQVDNLPKGGIGGEIGSVNNNIADLGNRVKIQYGEGYSESANKKIKDKINGMETAGGMGGNSATGAQGGCGGIKNDTYCSNEDTNATVSEMLMPVYSAILNQNYGKMGAGGGGGGWDKASTINQGRGSSGMPGYLFIYWDKPL